MSFVPTVGNLPAPCGIIPLDNREFTGPLSAVSRRALVTDTPTGRACASPLRPRSGPMPAATMLDTDEQATTTDVWLTLDEVAAKMRFPTRRALLAHLRRHPAPVFQRIGSARYFMRARDVDLMMAPIDLTNAASRRGYHVPADATFVQVDPAARQRPKPSKPRRVK